MQRGLKMKKLQFFSIMLLLLGIWFCFVPIGAGSKLPELAAIASGALGTLFGVISLFTKSK